MQDGATAIAEVRSELRTVPPAEAGLSDGGDPKYSKLELDRGFPEGLGGAPEARGVTLFGTKLRNIGLRTSVRRGRAARPAPDG